MIILDDEQQIKLQIFFDCVESNVKNLINYLKDDNNNFTRDDLKIFLLDLQIDIKEGKEFFGYNDIDREEGKQCN